MNRRERFLAACRREPVDRPPVWIMRQAGRYLPEYRELRAKHAFRECYRTPELAAEISLQPLRRFPLDAAIVFSDILIVPEAMGMTVEFPDGGPKLAGCVSDGAGIESLRVPDAARDLAYIGDAIRLIRAALGNDAAVLGFAGSPYTLGCYMTEGGSSHGKTFLAIRRLAQRDFGAYDALMRRICAAVGDLLASQIEAGADAVQIFDTWGGQLGPHDFEKLVLPYLDLVMARVRPLGRPVIYYVQAGEDVAALAASLKPDVLGVDWRSRLSSVRARVGDGVTLQGNIDPVALFGPEAEIRARVTDALRETGGHGHILNLGHGVLPQTPIEGVQAFLDAAGAYPETSS